MPKEIKIIQFDKFLGAKKSAPHECATLHSEALFIECKACRRYADREFSRYLIKYGLE
jgi:hypothetical protein